MIVVYCLQWYIVIQILGFLAFVLGYKLFSNLKDKGYCISKILGISFGSFISWWLMILNFKMYNFSPAVSYVSTGIFALITAGVILKFNNENDRKNLFNFFDKNYKFIALVEVAFLIVLITFGFIRAFSPDILMVHKLQEFVYINSILGSTSLPPDNSWLSGHTLNFFYTGYFMLANLVNLSALPLELAFNLIPGTILSLIILASGGIVYNLTESKTYGIIGAIITGFMGNFVALKEIFKAGFTNSFNWWSSAHCLTDNTFTEFPLWSAVQGDIEPFHLVNILFLALIYILIVMLKEDLFLFQNKLNYNSILSNVFLILIIALVITTDFYSLLTAVIIVFSCMLYKALFSQNRTETILKSVITTIIVFFGALIIDLPFLLSYTLPDISIKATTSNYTGYTESFLLVFGVFLIPFLVYMLLEIKKALSLGLVDSILSLILLCSLLELIILNYTSLSAVSIKIIIGICLLLLVISSGYRIYKKNNTKKFTTQAQIIIGLLVLLEIEFIIVKEIITVLITVFIVFSIYKLLTEKDFKVFMALCLYLTTFLSMIIISIPNMSGFISGIEVLKAYLIAQTLLLLPIALTIIIFELSKAFEGNNKEIYIIMQIIFLLPCFIFLALGTYEKSNKFVVTPGLLPELSGINHVKVFHESDYHSIKWLKEYASKNEVILEAFKPSESYSGRISGYSGLATILQGFDNQQFAYGKYILKELNQRVKDINKIYSEQDKMKVLHLINKYNITYIYVGEVERQIYPEESLNNFKEIGTLIFNTGDQQNREAHIYKIN